MLVTRYWEPIRGRAYIRNSLLSLTVPVTWIHIECFWPESPLLLSYAVLGSSGAPGMEMVIHADEQLFAHAGDAVEMNPTLGKVALQLERLRLLYFGSL